MSGSYEIGGVERALDLFFDNLKYFMFIILDKGVPYFMFVAALGLGSYFIYTQSFWMVMTVIIVIFIIILLITQIAMMKIKETFVKKKNARGMEMMIIMSITTSSIFIPSIFSASLVGVVLLSGINDITKLLSLILFGMIFIVGREVLRSEDYAISEFSSISGTIQNNNSSSGGGDDNDNNNSSRGSSAINSKYSNHV